MNNDNLGNFFNADDFGEDDENEESWKPIKVNGNALFKKAVDILNLTQSLCDVLPENEQAENTERLMLENAMVVATKIKGAISVDEIYSIVMENAVIIKTNIVQLKAQLIACNALHGIEENYLDVLRQEIAAFKKIFIQWVKCFDKENDLPDEWHLFNDPSTFNKENGDDLGV